jgi:hypothetical protein
MIWALHILFNNHILELLYLIINQYMKLIAYKLLQYLTVSSKKKHRFLYQ